jgi:CTP:molybdopterin cytidylyltransferase MocA
VSEPGGRRGPVEVVAVVLAAGEGRRFTGPSHKLRAPLGGRSVLGHAVRAALESGIGPVVVVTGAHDVSDLLPDGVAEVAAPDWAEGQSRSLAAGVGAADRLGASAVVVGLGDMPGVGPGPWRTVAAAPGEVVVATYDGRRRLPVKLARSVWGDLPTEGDEGARELMRRRPELVVDVPVEGDDRDVDTVADLPAGP